MPALKRALKRLEIAVDTGSDIAAAAKQTSRELKRYTDDLVLACGDDIACELNVVRKWQARNVKWTLSLNLNNTVVNNSIRNTLRRYLPEMICKRLNACK